MDLTLREGMRVLRLTEKERDILLALLEASGQRVERRDMLEKVWGYASGVETHTLETHVYRLRQKMEIDPAKPVIVLTDGDGYRLA
jgi:DNA-binding response OmpR family regulator